MGKFLHKFETFGEYCEAREDDQTAIITGITCAGETYAYSGRTGNDYLWVFSESGVTTETREPAVGDFAYDPVNGIHLEITGVETEPHVPKYHEPWVSLTKVYDADRLSAKLGGSGDTQTYEYVAPCKVGFLQ
jgi:hypothetical protein